MAIRGRSVPGRAAVIHAQGRPLLVLERSSGVWRDVKADASGERAAATTSVRRGEAPYSCSCHDARHVQPRRGPAALSSGGQRWCELLLTHKQQCPWALCARPAATAIHAAARPAYASAVHATASSAAPRSFGDSRV
eukprot:scaffold666_cov332-Prasinococcus_capsulatus_cf.AAC.10